MHLISWVQPAPTARFDGSIHAHIPALNQNFGLPPRIHHTQHLEKLAELDAGLVVRIVLHGVPAPT